MTDEDIRRAVSNGVVEGARRLAEDSDFAERFWRTGFEHLSRHSGNHASQWVGKRILTAIVASAVTAGVIWLVKSGYLK